MSSFSTVMMVPLRHHSFDVGLPLPTTSEEYSKSSSFSTEISFDSDEVGLVSVEKFEQELSSLKLIKIVKMQKKTFKKSPFTIQLVKKLDLQL